MESKSKTTHSRCQSPLKSEMTLGPKQYSTGVWLLIIQWVVLTQGWSYFQGNLYAGFYYTVPGWSVSWRTLSREDVHPSRKGTNSCSKYYESTVQLTAIAALAVNYLIPSAATTATTTTTTRHCYYYYYYYYYYWKVQLLLVVLVLLLRQLLLQWHITICTCTTYLTLLLLLSYDRIVWQRGCHY